MSKRPMKTMDGNTAAAYISYPFTEVAAIFPITPSSEMAELTDTWATQGKKNLFGSPVRVMEMQSEGGAAGALHGALQAGALSSTYTSSQGLLLMIPNMYKIAGELLPAVFHIAARSVASNSLSIFGDHQDVMSVRQTGFACLASRSVQDVMYLGAVAHLSAIKGRLPFAHFFDGFRTSHEMQKISLLEYEELNDLLDHDAVTAFRERSLSPNRPHVMGMTQNPDIFFQLREAVNPYYDALPSIVEEYMNAINKLTGSSYGLFSYYGHPEADRAILAMGSSCKVIEEAVDALNARGEKVGLITVHLYRPFVPEKLFSVLPASVKKLAVLDRTKEPGGEDPLFLDVRNAFYGKPCAPLIVSGRYGLASKEFTPDHAHAVFENLRNNEPKNRFTVGIEDDVTNTSLPMPAIPLARLQEGVTACKFWGFGSDGTVGANKTAIKIIGDATDLYAQAYFAYDSKKSGGVTVSHLRFGPSPIKSSYKVDAADFIACHNQSYVTKYDVLKGLKPGGTFLLNCRWSDAELEAELPARVKRYIAKKSIKLHTINAVDIAIELGISGRINMIMQAAFFALANIIPLEDAMCRMQAAIEDSYGNQGQNVVDKNLSALRRGVSDLHVVTVPAAWADATDELNTPDAKKPVFYQNVIEPMIRQEGDDLPVSAFSDVVDGRWPTGVSGHEKRGVAVSTAKWVPEHCIQCNQCSFVCPHAVLRPRLLTETEKNNAPEGLAALPATGISGKFFHLAVSSLDCTGCGLCVAACPAKTKALEMNLLSEQMPTCAALWEYTENNVPYEPLPEGTKISVKTSQFLQPLHEFSGACAGCGETPYAKLLSQLFGDRMMLSNAAGCSTVWTAGAPSVSYTTNKNGHGPAWGFSLFEDCAEYGFGMALGVNQMRNSLAAMITEALAATPPAPLAQAMLTWLEGKNMGEGTRERAAALEAALQTARGSDSLLNRIYALRDYFTKRSQWILGGDGWAYDIGYGGLDHVLAQHEDVNVLVFDTEVYSNTGGQASKATPFGAIAQFAAGGKPSSKKDLGLISMSYRSIYVAQVALGADKAQTLKAFVEAEAHQGPSIVIAYAPCINHGIRGGLVNSGDQVKKAVEVGYWPLYRYNPAHEAVGKNPFQLDSKAPKGSFADHLRQEVRYSALYKRFPEKADALFAEAEKAAKDRYAVYAKLAEDK